MHHDTRRRWWWWCVLRLCVSFSVFLVSSNRTTRVKSAKIP
jgi:hypothetical protein